MLRDVTEHRETERRLLSEERFFAEIVDCVADPIFVKDREYRFALVNDALCSMVGFPRGELLGKTDYDFFPAAQADFFRGKDAEMFATGSRVKIEEEPITDAAGATHVLSTIKAPLRDDRGEVTTFVEDGLVVDGDAKLLRIVLENLLGNAWKFTGRKPTAHIELRRTPVEGEGPAAFVVRDDGAGFDMTYVAKLFGAFQRLHGSKEFEGTGIGLATVQRIVHRHGGRIWAEAAVGRGAAFHFTLGA